jgi:hypothetical protein
MSRYRLLVSGGRGLPPPLRSKGFFSCDIGAVLPPPLPSLPRVHARPASRTERCAFAHAPNGAERETMITTPGVLPLTRHRSPNGVERRNERNRPLLIHEFLSSSYLRNLEFSFCVLVNSLPFCEGEASPISRSGDANAGCNASNRRDQPRSCRPPMLPCATRSTSNAV